MSISYVLKPVADVLEGSTYLLGGIADVFWGAPYVLERSSYLKDATPDVLEGRAYVKDRIEDVLELYILQTEWFPYKKTYSGFQKPQIIRLISQYLATNLCISV